MKTIILLALMQIPCPKGDGGCLALHEKATEITRFQMTSLSAYSYLKNKDYIEENDTIRVFLTDGRVIK